MREMSRLSRLMVVVCVLQALLGVVNFVVTQPTLVKAYAAQEAPANTYRQFLLDLQHEYPELEISLGTLRDSGDYVKGHISLVGDDFVCMVDQPNDFLSKTYEACIPFTSISSITFDPIHQ